MIHKNPLVSVVIPTYGRSELLPKAIESVLAQTYKNMEIFVIDDNGIGTEHQIETEQVLLRYIDNKQIIYLKHEKNAGGSVARNTGIKVAKGNFVALLDDDDEWFSNKIEKQIEYFSKLDETVGVIYCSYILKEHNGDREFIRHDKGDLTKKLLMLEFDPGASSTLLFRKSVLDEINGFDESFERHQDLEILIRVCRKYTIDVCSDILLKINGHNFPSAQKIENIKQHFFNIFHKDIKKFPFFQQQKIYARHYMELSLLYYLEKDIIHLLKYYLIAVLYYFPIVFKNYLNKVLYRFIVKKIKLKMQ